MLPMSMFRKNADTIRADHDKRGIPHDSIDAVIRLDGEWKSALHEMEMARRERNTAAKGIADAKNAEHGYKHSSIIHSRHVDNMTIMARELDCTLFVKNGPSTSGLGLGGEGYLTYSIATTTGEGITTPETFTRKRRCVMVDNLKIY